jgi:ABC-type nitrate/sulfonate/bicarbonate transport system substrate-binding protein
MSNIPRNHETQTIRLALEWFLNPDHLPLLIARDRGWLAEEGIALELVEPTDHFDAPRALAAGEIDVAITEPIHLLQDAAKGAELVGFARFLHTNGGVMVLERSGITRPRELAGRRLQYPGAPGPGGLAIAKTMIEADGGPADAPLEPVNHSFMHTNALAEDLADAATLVFYNFEVIEARHRGLAPRMFALKDWGVPDFCQLILIATPETVRERAGLLGKLLRAISRGIDSIKEDPEAARAVYLKATSTERDYGMGDAIFDATIPAFTHDFTMSRAYYDHLEAWLRKTDQVPDGVTFDLDQLWDNQLAVR